MIGSQLTARESQNHLYMHNNIVLYEHHIVASRAERPTKLKLN